MDMTARNSSVFGHLRGSLMGQTAPSSPVADPDPLEFVPVSDTAVGLTTEEQLDIAEKVIEDVMQAHLAISVAPDVIASEEALSPIEPVSTNLEPAPADLGPVGAALPQAIVQSSDTLNATSFSGRSGAKETLTSSNAAEQGLAEASAQMQFVEYEPQPEIPPEVEEYMQHVESHADQLPQEIAIALNDQTQMPSHTPKQSVLVVPITEEIEKKGERKSPLHSIRWLVEWSRRLMKMFHGKVIYRHES